MKRTARVTMLLLALCAVFSAGCQEQSRDGIDKLIDFMAILLIAKPAKLLILGPG